MLSPRRTPRRAALGDLTNSTPGQTARKAGAARCTPPRRQPVTPTPAVTTPHPGGARFEPTTPASCLRLDVAHLISPDSQSASSSVASGSRSRTSSQAFDDSPSRTPVRWSRAGPGSSADRAPHGLLSPPAPGAGASGVGSGNALPLRRLHAQGAERGARAGDGFGPVEDDAMALVEASHPARSSRGRASSRPRRRHRHTAAVSHATPPTTRGGTAVAAAGPTLASPRLWTAVALVGLVVLATAMLRPVAEATADSLTDPNLEDDGEAAFVGTGSPLGPVTSRHLPAAAPPAASGLRLAVSGPFDAGAPAEVPAEGHITVLRPELIGVHSWFEVAVDLRSVPPTHPQFSRLCLTVASAPSPKSAGGKAGSHSPPTFAQSCHSAQSTTDLRARAARHAAAPDRPAFVVAHAPAGEYVVTAVIMDSRGRKHTHTVIARIQEGAAPPTVRSGPEIRPVANTP